jgi:hypothetical protein
MARLYRRMVHVFVLALVLPLCLSSALPIFARALGGPVVHVCHCAAHGGPASCGCPICNPDRDDLAFSEESIRGKCGDDDLAFGAALASVARPGSAFGAPRSANAPASLRSRLSTQARGLLARAAKGGTRPSCPEVSARLAKTANTFGEIHHVEAKDSCDVRGRGRGPGRPDPGLQQLEVQQLVQ